MDVQLLYHTPLWVAAKAIRKCWASEGKSDTAIKRICEDCNSDRIEDICNDTIQECSDCKSLNIKVVKVAGPKDCELIDRVGNKFKHASTLEHLNYSFDIDGISRACLQELARHRHASLSVKSTRYTLKELRDTEQVSTQEEYSKYLVMTGHDDTDLQSIKALQRLQDLLKRGVSNDQAKFCLPESYKTSLVWTINARSLQNFLALRTNKAALWEIRDLANTIYTNLPNEHKYLFEEFIDESNA